MKQNLCKPCAIGLEQEGKTLTLLPARCKKITCGCCRRRRFGQPYEVTGRKRRTSRAEADQQG